MFAHIYNKKSTKSKVEYTFAVFTIVYNTFLFQTERIFGKQIAMNAGCVVNKLTQ